LEEEERFREAACLGAVDRFGGALRLGEAGCLGDEPGCLGEESGRLAESGRLPEFGRLAESGRLGDPEPRDGVGRERDDGRPFPPTA
jgi:hypothetical protein